MKKIRLNWNNYEEVSIGKLTILCGISGDDKLQLYQRHAIGSSLEYIDMPENGLTERGQFTKGINIAFDASELDSDQFLVIETHSCHILNAIRISVINDVINADDIKIYFMTRTGETKTQLYEPIIDAYGFIDEWPPGFFDQEQIALAQIFAGQKKKKTK